MRKNLVLIAVVLLAGCSTTFSDNDCVSGTKIVRLRVDDNGQWLVFADDTTVALYNGFSGVPMPGDVVTAAWCKPTSDQELLFISRSELTNAAIDLQKTWQHLDSMDRAIRRNEILIPNPSR